MLHSLNMRFIVPSLSPHDLHLLFCCVLSLLALIWLFLMALFCAAFWRDSVSQKKFPFVSHIHVFTCEMSLVNHLKLPQSRFPSHFCFLVICILLDVELSELFLVGVISLLLPFSLYSSSLCIDVSTLSSMLTSPLPRSFLDTCQWHMSVSMSFMRFNTFCLVISFLVLWSICLSSSLVYFNNGPKYLTTGIVQDFIPFITFQRYNFVSSRFLVLLRSYLNYYCYFTAWEFFTPTLSGGLSLEQIYSGFPRIFSTMQLSIIRILSLISTSLGPLSNTVKTVTILKLLTLSLSCYTPFSSFLVTTIVSQSFIFTLWSAEKARSSRWQFLFFSPFCWLFFLCF